ncbi:YraN family protein [Paenibacillus macerans]|uniref:YraN family protein n=1 Tax=Paenibacillus macerans TaxID=44252 RepID=UPI003D323D83
MSNPELNKGRFDGRKERGRRAEQAAGEYLKSLGYAVIARNWRCRSGEIDLVASHGNTIVIVEVRSRSLSAAAFGTPAESITARKIRQVRDTAAVYLHQTGQSGANIRFDVVAVTFGSGSEFNLEHIQSAF